MSALKVSEATRLAQLGASDPTSSVIVAANAGSGKTHVLTERVVRLLLAGAEPSKILCLTYTKAAAAEMSTRVFARLSAWATASDAALSKELERLLGRPVAAKDRAGARRLFAEALETPGGLKIQTIHAFCEAILHQFPLEANVPGHFHVLDDKESALVLAEARRRLVTGDGHPPAERAALAGAFAEALALGGEWGLDALLAEIVSRRDAVRRFVEASGGIEAAVARTARALGLASPDDTEDAVIARHFATVEGFDAEFRESLLAVARTSDKATDRKLAQLLEAAGDTAKPAARLEALRALAFTKAGEPKKPGSVATKAVADFHADFVDRLDRLVRQIQALDDRLASLRLFRASRAALAIADRLEEDYAELKRRRGRLDFEDLVVRTADLLTRSEAANWVHYKLDRGIDHVLIDEAQDTSPRQWQVMRSLVEEFFVGASARQGPRTVFAVGDEKQSIYSFQGASPLMFAEERRRLRARAEDAGLRFTEQQLHQSFRSTKTVLDAVDLVFADPANRQGLSSDGLAPAHATARGAEAGVVEVWPPFVASPLAEPEDWLEAVDVEPESSPANRLARRIAAAVKAWLGTPVRQRDGTTRPLTPGDVLILVRKRSGFVEAMGKALRDERIAVAGADRLLLTDHIAVQDLMALGRAVANIEDELSLAACLKSPLFGFTDDELMALALSRNGHDEYQGLFFALRDLAGRKGPSLVPAFVPKEARPALLARADEAYRRLEALRSRTGFVGVFAFYSRILGPEGSRALLTARLGHDAGEVIDAFLDLALAAEEEGRLGLDSFLADLASAPPEVKREMEHGRTEVRIMTVHASKGLEAPAVFLVDPGSAPFSHAHGARLMRWDTMPGLRPGEAPGFLWRADKSLENAAVKVLREEEKRLAEEEYRRLLYVGMTRAADRLVVCGTAGTRGGHEESWLARVAAALAPHAEPIPDADGEPAGWRYGGLAAEATVPAAPDERPAPLRDIDLRELPSEAPPPRPLSPSAAGEVHRLESAEDETTPTEETPTRASPVLSAAGDDAAAARRGTLVHRMLEVLPDLPLAERADAARTYLGRAASDLAATEREAMARSVLAVLEDARFAGAFAPDSRAEVSVAGTIELGGRSYAVAGAVDRIAASEHEVLVLDYKTVRPPPAALDEVPPAYVLQLALYRQLLQPIYPDREVRAALLFTEGPWLVDVPGEAMDEALRRRAHVSEGETPRSRDGDPA
ncbi:double-strand break repair helicase AddA [Aureimonas leprariae]|uniref:DNA 3'-5' helicase n=1 Tax=Plantimonas leprariae TaxID=2615207 RepID=A0A7V7PTD3_9HYPH|nr:double-strand break repair helicase AddA [Aureimonas leprariae]KAB0682897.1 double-strand break repair helicase AddA [Aureimonas leprariae]